MQRWRIIGIGIFTILLAIGIYFHKMIQISVPQMARMVFFVYCRLYEKEIVISQMEGADQIRHPPKTTG